ncbi:hypothetical protein L3X38_017988 [Prunus dulcis]|uniref:Trichome birefringence-like C-terminal domain-containing protein n=1 Tax=Prunus dulcis TaxID=3755 RepID=A0AAD4WAR9_PRUDU|nr:hypothetical protein L3X38_017988 [Prunus dulcis]
MRAILCTQMVPAHGCSGVHEVKARVGQKRVQTLRNDSIDHGSSRWRGADILVFNTAHWWSHYKTKAGINYYQEGDQIHPQLDVSTAFRKALIFRSHHRKWRTESRSDGIPSEANSPRTYTRSSPLNSPFGSNDSLQKRFKEGKKETLKQIRE